MARGAGGRVRVRALRRAITSCAYDMHLDPGLVRRRTCMCTRIQCTLTKIKTTKINSDGLLLLFTKFSTPENYPLYGMCIVTVLWYILDSAPPSFGCSVALLLFSDIIA